MSQGVNLSLLIFFAVVVGFMLGWRLHRHYNLLSKKTFAHTYYRGMSYLINEQTDSSVDKFIGSLEVNSETLEIHLALGNLMRKKGESAKAIKIHQNLLDCRGLNGKQQHLAQLELARDYVSAGLLDRAESLFRELIEINSQYKLSALEHLIEIYQDEKEWEKAIQAAATCVALSRDKNSQGLLVAIAHYHCELALIAMEKSNLTAATSHLTQAMEHDQHSVRASLIGAQIAFDETHYSKALQTLKKVPEQDPELINISLELMCNIHERIGDKEALLAELLHLLKCYPSNELVVTAAETLSKVSGDRAAVSFVAEQLKKRPSIKVLTKLVEFHLHHSEGEAKENLLLLKQLVDQVIAEKPNYHCVKCGFTGSRLHWLCPGCKTWGSVRLIRGVAGD